MYKKSLRKMYITVCSIILFAILVFFVLQSLFIRSTLLVYTEQVLEAAHTQSYDNINNYLANVENIALSLSYNALVQRFLKETEDIERLRHFPDLQTVFSALFMSQPDVIGFAIYDHQGRFITANAANYQAIVQTQYITEKHNFITYARFSYSPFMDATLLYYVMTVPVFDFSTAGVHVPRIGTIVFTMDKTYINSQIELGNLLYGASMALVDGYGYVMSGKLNGNISESAIVSLFSNTGWKLVTHLEAGVITEHLQPLILITIGISLVVVAFIIIFVIFLSARMLIPINGISSFMKNITNEKATSRTYLLPEKYSYDELVSMSKAMNRMIQSLDEKTEALLNKEKEHYEVTLMRNRLEILAYRSQINPHFLYNTFECIAGIAISRDAPEIVEMSAALSQMFSYAVKEADFVTVAEELAHIEYYALIIGYRFMGRIRINIDAEAAAASCRIPRLILQPMVENAVFHGLEPKIGEGTLNVTVSIREGFLHIKVSDDGIGMDDIARERLKGLDSDREEKGIGLPNIMRRLKIFYGDNAEIKIESTQQKGCTVELKLPADEGDMNV